MSAFTGISVTCTSCKGLIEQLTQPRGTAWCRCGRTYLTWTESSYGYGGPGAPREDRPEPHEESRPIHVPSSSKEWEELLAATGVPPPDHFWLMQDSSGNVADDVDSWEAGGES